MGNGLRFGLPYLFYELGVSVAGVGSVVAVSGYWASHLSAEVDLLIGIAALPLFFSGAAALAAPGQPPARRAGPTRGVLGDPRPAYRVGSTSRKESGRSV